jgi:hypothetical protein
MKEEILRLERDLLLVQKELAIQQLAQIQIHAAVLRSLEPSAVQRIKTILAAQAADCAGQQSLSAQAISLAVELVALATDREAQPDPKAVLRLIQGGKKES